MPAKNLIDQKAFRESLHASNIPDEAIIAQLDNVLDMIHMALLMAFEGVIDNKTLGKLSMIYESDPSLYTQFEHDKFIRLENRSKPVDVLINGENLYVSIAARLKSIYYPVLSANPNTLKKNFLEDLISDLDDFLLYPDFSSMVRIHSLASGLIGAGSKIDCNEYRELLELAMAVNRFCNLRMLSLKKLEPAYLNDLQLVFVRAKNMLRACKDDKPLGN